MNNSTLSMQDKAREYIAYKRSLGYKYGKESYMLMSFAEYADHHAPGKPLTINLALRWSTKPQTENKTYHAKRLSALRTFARYLIVNEPETEIPPCGILGPSHSRVEPYIYTQNEIAMLMGEALKMTQVGLNTVTYSTVIGLLACTGMRIGEILALDREDVDLEKRIITVRDSKNLPMRLVPITNSTAAKLREYVEKRDHCYPQAATGAFILSAHGKRLRYNPFWSAFRRIREKAGMATENGSGHKPRIHDFRHTFACNHLLKAYRTKRDIDNAVHELAVYLGHANMKATYWYLTGIPVLFELCGKRFEEQVAKRRNGGEA